jgi:hypothetical protein
MHDIIIAGKDDNDVYRFAHVNLDSLLFDSQPILDKKDLFSDPLFEEINWSRIPSNPFHLELLRRRGWKDIVSVRSVFVGSITPHKDVILEDVTLHVGSPTHYNSIRFRDPPAALMCFHRFIYVFFCWETTGLIIQLYNEHLQLKYVLCNEQNDSECYRKLPRTYLPRTYVCDLYILVEYPSSIRCYHNPIAPAGTSSQ